MEMAFQQAVTDVQLCGAKFVDPSGSAFGVTGYDLGEIVMFSKQWNVVFKLTQFKRQCGWREVKNQIKHISI